MKPFQDPARYDGSRPEPPYETDPGEAKSHVDAEKDSMRDEIERLTKERDLALANADGVYAKLMSDNDRLRAALWPFAMKGLKGTTVCADDFRRAKEAMPHAPDFEWPRHQQRKDGA